MSRRAKYNPERRSWRGKSHKKGQERVRDLRDAAAKATALERARDFERIIFAARCSTCGWPSRSNMRRSARGWCIWCVNRFVALGEELVIQKTEDELRREEELDVKALRSGMKLLQCSGCGRLWRDIPERVGEPHHCGGRWQDRQRTS